MPTKDQNTEKATEVNGAAAAGISVSDATADLVKERVAQLADPNLVRQRKSRRTGRVANFRRRLRRRWGEALDTLEELVATCAELGDLVSLAHYDDTQLFLALQLLRNRAVQVGWEVHTLAKSGYADGAYGRWRTLHELAVVSEFLCVFGEDAATRYLEHAAVKNRRVIREYNECQNRLGYPRIPQAEIDHSVRLKNQLLHKYGREFGNEWGWAAKACGKRNPSFFDLRESAGYAHWKAHSGMANHAVHAGPHGILFRIGHPLGSEPLPLSGPSLVGLGDPIDACAISEMHATFAFVSAIRKEDDVQLEGELEITALIQHVSILAKETGNLVELASERVEREFGSHRAVSEE